MVFWSIDIWSIDIESHAGEVKRLTSESLPVHVSESLTIIKKKK